MFVEVVVVAVGALVFAIVVWMAVMRVTFAFKRGEAWFVAARRGSGWTPEAGPWEAEGAGDDPWVVGVSAENLKESVLDVRTFTSLLVSSEGARGGRELLERLVRSAGGAVAGGERAGGEREWICVVKSEDHRFVSELRALLLQFLS
ncbi:MAG: hypothetical protein Kow0069_30460 [Promethearchaeota archaeon]